MEEEVTSPSKEPAPEDTVTNELGVTRIRIEVTADRIGQGEARNRGTKVEPWVNIRIEIVPEEPIGE